MVFYYSHIKSHTRRHSPTAALDLALFQSLENRTHAVARFFFPVYVISPAMLVGLYGHGTIITKGFPVHPRECMYSTEQRHEGGGSRRMDNWAHRCSLGNWRPWVAFAARPPEPARSVDRAVTHAAAVARATLDLRRSPAGRPFARSPAVVRLPSITRRRSPAATLVYTPY